MRTYVPTDDRQSGEVGLEASGARAASGEDDRLDFEVEDVQRDLENTHVFCVRKDRYRSYPWPEGMTVPVQDIVNKNDIEKLSEKDSVFSFIDGKYGPPPNWKRDQGFVSLAKIILEQQISLSSATAHFNKINGYLGEFTAEEILKLSDAEMRQFQISRQKTSYLRALASAVKNQSIMLDAFDAMDKTDVRTQLTSIKGIGQWTADIYLMVCLQEKDIFPPRRYRPPECVRRIELCSNKRRNSRFDREMAAISFPRRLLFLALLS